MVLQDKSIYYNTLTYQFTSLTYSRVTSMHIYDSNLKEVVMLEVSKVLTNVSTVPLRTNRKEDLIRICTSPSIEVERVYAYVTYKYIKVTFHKC